MFGWVTWARSPTWRSDLSCRPLVLVQSVLPEHSLGQGSKRSRKRRRAEGQGRGGAVESAEEHKCTKPMIDRIQALAGHAPFPSHTITSWHPS